MIRLSRRACITLAFVPLSACGSSPDTPTETTGTCRRYATGRTSVYSYQGYNNSTSSTESGACVFDQAARTLRCATTVTGGGCASRVSTRNYATVADFVEEAQAIGRLRWDSQDSVDSGGCGGQTARVRVTFDGQRRPVGATTKISDSLGPDFTSETVFTAWDGFGRPTRSTASTAGCRGVTGERIYDDTARTLTSRDSPGVGNECSASGTVQTFTYDANGNVTRETWTSGISSFTRTTTITSTATVCF